MDTGHVYEICVEGQLSDRWSDWFAGLAIHGVPHGRSCLRGYLPDQAALFGVLTRLHALNLVLISVTRLGE